LNRLEERAYNDEIERLLLRPLCILPRFLTKMQPFRGKPHPSRTFRQRGKYLDIAVSKGSFAEPTAGTPLILIVN